MEQAYFKRHQNGINGQPAMSDVFPSGGKRIGGGPIDGGGTDIANFFHADNRVGKVGLDKPAWAD